MTFHVEPRDGDDLDRLITVVLNLTGIVSHVVDDARHEAVDGADGVAVIGAAARRLRGALTALPAQHGAEQVGVTLEVLTDATFKVRREASLM